MPSTKRPPAKKRSPSRKEANAKLVRENKQLKRERDEGAEQQAAMSAILRIIARTPTDLQPVLVAIVESAARVCGAEDASVRLLDGGVLRLMAHVGEVPSTTAGLLLANEPILEQLLTECETVHIHDILAED